MFSFFRLIEIGIVCRCTVECANFGGEPGSGNTLIFGKEKSAADIVEHLVKNGARISLFREREDSLEDLYMEFSGKEKAKS